MGFGGGFAQVLGQAFRSIKQQQEDYLKEVAAAGSFWTPGPSAAAQVANPAAQVLRNLASGSPLLSPADQSAEIGIGGAMETALGNAFSSTSKQTSPNSNRRTKTTRTRPGQTKYGLDALQIDGGKLSSDPNSYLY